MIDPPPDKEPLDESVLERLNQFDWHRLSRELALYAVKKVKVLYWGPAGCPDRLPKGFQATELVTEAISRVYTGRRRWDPDTQPDIYQYLCGVIDSIVSSLLKSRDLRTIKNSSRVEEVEPADNSPDPEQQLIDGERLQFEGEFLMTVVDRAAKDPLVMAVLECILDGEGRPRMIAQRLKRDVSEINNAKKRLDRMITELKVEVSPSFLAGSPS